MKLRFVCGKGGVGKTLITSALAEIYSRKEKTLIISLNQPELISKYLDCPVPSNEPFEITDNLWVVHIDSQKCLNDFIKNFLKVGLVSKWIIDHPLYPFISATAPGLKEFLMLDRIMDMFFSPPVTRWDHIIVDTPATGHALNLFSITHGLKAAIKKGPLRKRILRIEETFKNKKLTKIILVTVPDYQPIEEAITMFDKINDKLNMHLSCILINMFPPKPPNLLLHTRSKKTLLSTINNFFRNIYDPKLKMKLSKIIEENVIFYKNSQILVKSLIAHVTNIPCYKIPYFNADSEYGLLTQLVKFFMDTHIENVLL